MTLRHFSETFRGHRVPTMNIIGRRRLWFAISGFFIVLSLVGLAFRGLNFSIEFTGGALLEFPNQSNATVAEYQQVMNRFGVAAEVEILGGNTVSIRTEDVGLTPTPAPSPTPTATPTVTPTPTGTASPTATPSPTASPSPTVTPSPTATATPGGSAVTPTQSVQVAELIS